MRPKLSKHFVSILLHVHVDKIHYNDAPYISQAQLLRNLSCRLKIGFQNCLLRISLTLSSEASGVHVDRNQRLGGRSEGSESAPAR